MQNYLNYNCHCKTIYIFLVFVLHVGVCSDTVSRAALDFTPHKIVTVTGY